MCVYCNIIGRPHKPDIEGINTIVVAFVNPPTIKTLTKFEFIKKPQVLVRAFELGLTRDNYPESISQASSFSSQPVSLVAITSSLEQLSFLESLADECFAGSLGHAVGWVVAKGLGTTESGDAAAASDFSAFNEETQEFIVRAAPRVRQSSAAPRKNLAPKEINHNDQKIVVPNDVPSRYDLVSMRQKLGLSQRALASRIGMSRGFLADMELGRDRHSSDRTRFRVFLGIQDIAKAENIALM